MATQPVEAAAPGGFVDVGGLPESQGHEGMPLVLRPAGDRRTEALADWIGEHGEWVRGQLREHGAVLFRGFGVRRALDFERVALAVDPGLQNEYLGTSPRNWLTDYTFTASELPGFYPIPQHCEMSFLETPPRRVFFCCLEPPERGGGETPLVDFRRVYRELDPAVRERFEEGGIRIIRNYDGPSGGNRFDLWKLKRWHEMFLTTDRAVVEEKCREQGFEASWGPGDKLRLISEQPATQRHPETGEPAWFNHVQVFHLDTAPQELRRVWRHHDRHPRNWALWKLTEVVVRLRRRTPAEQQSMHCTYQDGREIPLADLEHLRDVIWRNMVRFPWERGDVIALDNHSVSHGRMPYRGKKRMVAVAWA